MPALPGEKRGRGLGSLRVRSINADPAWWFLPRQVRSVFFSEEAGVTDASQAKRPPPCCLASLS
jgi:hypothetical protein